MDATASADLRRVRSADGTTITYERFGSGPPVILVCGGSVDRWSNVGLAGLLAPTFTVYNYDRRGRGESGDTPPYAVEREIEDIAAVLDAAGGSSALYGSSSGAALALHAAAALPGITRLVLWEPPYFADDSWPRPPADQVEQYNRMLAEGRRGDAAEYFMAKVVGLPPQFIADARSQPWWPAQEALAHTLPYDATIMGDYSVPLDLARGVSIPTLVLTGDASFPFMGPTARALADALPNGSVAALPGQRHDVDDAVLAPAVAEFLGAG